ncbi:unnamed protein product [Rotaria sp. Silwood2]|nr:unnamed protein product [Rotaria sp. Silwood2]CAF4270224.1 unnamed protein product [Rotaria sp. Silwood2]
MGTTFDETQKWELQMKKQNPWKEQMYGSIVCYTTLKCDFGRLCLDWRDICDGIQQCMFGFDEENCDKLEFNECENDEYRCTNGMCIPEEYFLDGEFDCLDWSDEIQYYRDENCALDGVNIYCDDRMCPSDQWSCGVGQCIVDRLGFQKPPMKNPECINRRDQYFMCEIHHNRTLWTLPNGRCYPSHQYDEQNMTEYSSYERCQYLLKCALSRGAMKYCPCANNDSCITNLLKSHCSGDYIQY